MSSAVQMDNEGTAGAAQEEANLPTFAEQFTPEFREANKDLLSQYSGKKLQELVEPLVALQRTVKERGLIVPNEKSTPEERAAFHERMGLPMKAEDYELAADEKLLPKEYVEEQRKYYFAHGFTKKQAQDDLARIQETVKKGLEARAARTADAEKNYKANLVQTLKGDIKAADETENLAKKYIKATFSEKSRKELVDSSRVYDPDFLVDMANAQRKLEPHRRVDESGQPTFEPAPGGHPRGKFGDQPGAYGGQWREAFAESAGGKR
jgi:hypothetical protein